MHRSGPAFRTIGIALMVSLRDMSGADVSLRNTQLALRHMSGVLADEGSDGNELRNKEQSGQPRTQTT